jgi:exopolysaccharide biosynthesis polyprenyl glycosylphosphotransferase
MRSLYKFVSGIILTIAATACFFAAWWNFISENNTTGRLMEYENLALAIGIYVVIFWVLADWQCAFKIGVKRFASISAGLILVIFTTDLFEIPISMAICGHFEKYAFRFIIQYLLLAIAQTFLLCFLTYLLVVLYVKIFPFICLLEVTGDHKNNLAEKVNTQTNGYRIKESVNYAIGEMELIEKMGKVDGVLIGDVPAKAKNTILKTCLKMGKSTYFVPKISDIIVRESEEINWLDTPLFLNQNTGIGKWRGVVKRIFDVLLSVIALALFSPVMLIVALAIKLEDGGPVIFKQERCTLHNKRFMILKFRSMIVEAEMEDKPHPTENNDPRITKVGRVIRAMRIDELPQLINIVKGDMSIVGPRPERVEHVEKYTKEIPEFVLRGMVRGGLTGYAQVYGKYNTQPLDKLKLDLLYIMNFSLILDLEIMVETVYTLFRKDSTEGFSKESIENIQK